MIHQFPCLISFSSQQFFFHSFHPFLIFYSLFICDWIIICTKNYSTSLLIRKFASTCVQVDSRLFLPVLNGSVLEWLASFLPVLNDSSVSESSEFSVSAIISLVEGLHYLHHVVWQLERELLLLI